MEALKKQIAVEAKKSAGEQLKNQLNRFEGIIKK